MGASRDDGAQLRRCGCVWLSHSRLAGARRINANAIRNFLDTGSTSGAGALSVMSFVSSSAIVSLCV